jgi:hypothetical protein
MLAVHDRVTCWLAVVAVKPVGADGALPSPPPPLVDEPDPPQPYRDTAMTAASSVAEGECNPNAFTISIMLAEKSGNLGSKSWFAKLNTEPCARTGGDSPENAGLFAAADFLIAAS